jgi:hypothetical protein
MPKRSLEDERAAIESTTQTMLHRLTEEITFDTRSSAPQIIAEALLHIVRFANPQLQFYGAQIWIHPADGIDEAAMSAAATLKSKDDGVVAERLTGRTLSHADGDRSVGRNERIEDQDLTRQLEDYLPSRDNGDLVNVRDEAPIEKEARSHSVEKLVKKGEDLDRQGTTVMLMYVLSTIHLLLS